MASRFARFINSETGPKTVHFWAPVCKWLLVAAGASDMVRPVETVLGTQQAALLATGAIWTRWCLIIKPKNYFLASVNFFLGVVAGAQVVRIFSWRLDSGDSVGQALNYLALGKKALIADQAQEALDK